MNNPPASARAAVPHTPPSVTPAQKVKANVLPARPSLLDHRMELLTAQVGQLVQCGLE